LAAVASATFLTLSGDSGKSPSSFSSLFMSRAKALSVAMQSKQFLLRGLRPPDAADFPIDVGSLHFSQRMELQPTGAEEALEEDGTDGGTLATACGMHRVVAFALCTTALLVAPVACGPSIKSVSLAARIVRFILSRSDSDSLITHAI
jgi:hypothetical protein